MQARRSGLSELIRLLALATVITFSLSAVSLAYAVGRHAATPSRDDLSTVRTVG